MTDDARAALADAIAKVIGDELMGHEMDEIVNLLEEDGYTVVSA